MDKDFTYGNGIATDRVSHRGCTTFVQIQFSLSIYTIKLQREC